MCSLGLYAIFLLVLLLQVIPLPLQLSLVNQKSPCPRHLNDIIPFGYRRGALRRITE